VDGGDIADPAHIRSKMIDLIEATTSGDETVLKLPKVKKLKFVCRAGFEFGVLDVNPRTQ